MQPVLVHNPNDGKTYDLTPIFEYLVTERTSFPEMSDQCLQAGDMIIQIIDPSSAAFTRDVQNSTFFIANLRDVFKKVKAQVEH